MALGPGTPIEALPASAPHVSLLSSITVQEPGNAEWEGGFRWDPELCAVDFGVEGDFPFWWECADDGGATPQATVAGGIKPVAANPAIREYQPWTAHVAYACRPTNNDATQRDHEAKARRRLESNLSRIIERELWEGTVATAASFPNDFFTNSPATIAGGPHGHSTALAELEQAIADNQNGLGMIHAQPRVVSLWSRNGHVGPAAPGGRRLVTALGTTVVPGQGYTGAGTAGGAAGDINSSWAFAIDQIRVFLGPVDVVPGTIGEATDRSANLTVYRAERTVAAFWDGCTKTGVQVDHEAELT